MEVWLYTSMYESVLAELEPLAAARLPHVRLVPLQGGSEKIAQRFEAELAAGSSQACLLATSDPAWFASLAERDQLQAYVPPRALDLPPAWRSPTASAFRLSLMVLASSGGEAPTAWRDLVDPRFRDRFSTPDPLASGTALTAVAAWQQAFGDPFLDALQANGWIAAGGSSAVVARMGSGERAVGVVLLENLLLSAGAPAPIFPAEGAVVVPGLVAIPRGCPHREAAEDVVDWLLSDEAQAVIVRGGMHSPLPGQPAPAGVPALVDLPLLPLPDDFFRVLATQVGPLKTRLAARGTP